MTILLIGEYNSSHYTLKEGLESLGHKVTVIGFGDGFKNRMVDVNFKHKYSTGIVGIFRKILYRTIGIDITSNATKRQFYKHEHLFKDNDVVQLINENSFYVQPKTEMELLSYIFKNNKKVFLLSCGTDYSSVKYAMDKKFRYSIMTPYFEKKGNKKQFVHVTQHLLPRFVELHQYIFKNIDGVIASDLDYHIPLLGNPKYMGMVPNPINIKKFKYSPPVIKNKVIIFHGINEKNYYKKGNDLFEKALNIISSKYPDSVEIITARSVPYDEYITLFDDAHILLDQVYAYDQGFNALEAMAKGKVVFTGAEQEWLDYYGLEEDTVAINALPDPIKIAAKLEWLIENPEKITEISQHARQFIEKEHDHIESAQKYLEKYTR